MQNCAIYVRTQKRQRAAFDHICVLASSVPKQFIFYFLFQVAICDNLDLPFRDESFDAVLSLAVVHHFATTERRVGAIRELARILRIGGRVIITVWALEQKNRRFESQDVLVPWHPKTNGQRNGLNSDDDDEDDLPYHPCIEDSTTSSKSTGDGDTSSLSSSSPSDTCYSFVRKAIQVSYDLERSCQFKIYKKILF